METQNTTIPKKIFTTCEDMYYSEYKNTVIIVLLVLLILAILGINVCEFIGTMGYSLLDPFIQVVRNILSMLGYGVGSAINDVADAVSDGAKIGVDIADGTVHDATYLLMEATDKPSDEELAKERAIAKKKKEKCEGFSVYMPTFDDKINKSSVSEPPPPSPFMEIQPLMTNNTSGDDWCKVNMMDSIEGSRNCKSFMFLS